MPGPPTRRELAAGLLLPTARAQSAKPRVIDAHQHLAHHGRPAWAEDDRKLIDAADRLGIDQMCCSIVPAQRPATLEACVLANDWVAEAVKRFPGRILGYAFLNPGYGRRAVDEIRRRVDAGFIGVKLYNDYRVTDPAVAPVLEAAAELRIPVLHHAGHTSWLPSPQPNISDAGDMARAGRAFPETTIICAHLCGGGDWEWSAKALRDAPPNVFLDTSGSVADEGTVELAVKMLGEDRVLFATDLSMTASVGRLRGARIDESARRKVLGGNMARILARRRA